VDAILLSKGSIGSAQDVATAFGMRNRFRLARLLKKEGLPPLHRLTEWVTVLAWVDSAERKGSSLCAMAFRSGRDPSVCYRMVKTLTGQTWEVVLARGAAWVLQQFVKELEALGANGMLKKP